MVEPSAKRRNFYVYTITNVIDGTIYVGKSVDPNYRFGVHKSRSKNERLRTTHLLKALYTHGFDVFQLSVVSEHDDENHAYDAERKLCVKLKQEGARLYNEKEGGKGGHSNPTKELRQKLSASRSGMKHPLYGKPSPRRGIKLSTEQVENFKAAIRNKNYGKLGSQPSNETKELWSKQRRGVSKPHRPTLTHDEKCQIIQMFESDMTAQEISKQLSRCSTTVRKVIKSYLTSKRKID